MKLYYSTTSPFARKIRIASKILGFEKEIELVAADVYNDSTYSRVNPLMKIPALQTRQGHVLTNSPYILEYLNSLSMGKKIISTDHDEKWMQLNDQSIADGIMEAAVLRRYESLRAYDRRDEKFDQRQKDKIQNALEYFENHIFRLREDWGVGEISLLCALSYLEFRTPQDHWLETFSNIKNWYKMSLSRPEVQKTQPS